MAARRACAACVALCLLCVLAVSAEEAPPPRAKAGPLDADVDLARSGASLLSHAQRCAAAARREKTDV
jgi:hypothetical protein